MTLETNMQKTEMDALVEFYYIKQGITEERYTSYPSALTFNGDTWTAISVKRGKLTKDTGLTGTSLSIKIPVTPAIAQYIPNHPIEPVTVTIYRASMDDSFATYAIFFRGNIANVIISDDGMAQVQLESNNRLFKRKIPGILYQSFCNHDLFDEGCGLVDTNFVRTALVTALENNGATISYTFSDGGGTPDAGYFTVGYIELDTDIRLITSNPTTSQITIHVPFDSRLAVDETVRLYPGCDGVPETCVNTFSNLSSFLGMPYIPSSNPVIWGFKK